MTTKTDPGSYTITDEPFDTYGATYVPLDTPRGPVTLMFNGDIIDVRSGYKVNEYSHGEVTRTDEMPGFTVDAITVGGSASFTVDGKPRDDAHLYGKGGTITPRREADILAYWAEVVRRYVAEHPHIPAHAAHRDAIRRLNSHADKIKDAEEALKTLRAERTSLRREVRDTLASSLRTETDGAMNAPRPYYNETLNGYVIELMNDPAFQASIGR